MTLALTCSLRITGIRTQPQRTRRNTEEGPSVHCESANVNALAGGCTRRNGAAGARQSCRGKTIQDPNRTIKDIVSSPATTTAKEVFELLRDDLAAIEREFGRDTVSS